MVVTQKPSLLCVVDKIMLLADGSIGIEAFVTRAQELAASYGDRFLPPASLLERARAGASIE